MRIEEARENGEGEDVSDTWYRYDEVSKNSKKSSFSYRMLALREKVISLINPFPSLLQCAVVGCAEAPEIVPEGPGYRC